MDGEAGIGRGTWGWTVPGGPWEVAEPLIPPAGVRPQGGGSPDTPDEKLFAAIIYVMVSGCSWRALPPCFGMPKHGTHRRFLIWSRAGIRGRLHRAVLHRPDNAGLLDIARVVLGPSLVDRRKPGTKMHIPSDTNRLRLPLIAGTPAGNVHDCKGLKPMAKGHQTHHVPYRRRYFDLLTGMWAEGYGAPRQLHRSPEPPEHAR